MTEIERLVKQLERTFHGRTWHGPAVEEVLAGITAKSASRLAPGCAHTIWQMVEHMRIWQDAPRRWLSGDRTRPQDEETWPTPSDTSEAAWSATLGRLRATHAALVAEVAKLDESRLSERVFDDMPNLYAILHGVVQHNVYHAGQIAVLKKAGT
jgi:hypothetical protein